MCGADLIDQSFILTLTNFFNNTLLDYIKFSRDVIINITGLPVGLFIALAGILGVMLSLFIITLVLKFIFNGIALFRAGKSTYRAVS